MEETNKNKYTIQHRRSECIGCASCEGIAPQFWKMEFDGKASIRGVDVKNNGGQEMDIKEEDFQVNKSAAESCPVNVIHILDKATKKIIV